MKHAVLVLVLVEYNRRREAQIKYPSPDDDVRENIINYEDEGGNIITIDIWFSFNYSNYREKNQT